MRTIHKFPLDLAERQSIEVPLGSRILCVQLQHGLLCVWVEVDTDRQLHSVELRIVGTGHERADGNFHYVGTVQQDGMVWHLYAEGSLL